MSKNEILEKWPAKNKCDRRRLFANESICAVFECAFEHTLPVLKIASRTIGIENWVVDICLFSLLQPNITSVLSHRKSSCLLLHNTLISCMDSNAQYKLIYEFMKWYFHFGLPQIFCFDHRLTNDLMKCFKSIGHLLFHNSTFIFVAFQFERCSKARQFSTEIFLS